MTGAVIHHQVLAVAAWGEHRVRNSLGISNNRSAEEVWNRDFYAKPQHTSFPFLQGGREGSLCLSKRPDSKAVRKFLPFLPPQQTRASAPHFLLCAPPEEKRRLWGLSSGADGQSPIRSGGLLGADRPPPAGAGAGLCGVEAGRSRQQQQRNLVSTRSCADGNEM